MRTRKKKTTTKRKTGGTFSLTAKQKKNLPKALQKAIIQHHKKKGKKIV